MQEAGDGVKRMRLRYAGVCRICGTDLPARAEALYERTTRTVICVGHDPDALPERVLQESASTAPSEPVDPGIPGASARREFERRRTAREERIRGKHPRLGGLILATGSIPQSTVAWSSGAVGEERLGAGLNERANDSLRILHDRRVPGSRANVDHLAVAPAGVFVIDAKRYSGRPSIRVEGGIIGPRVEKLLVGRRDRSGLVEGVLKQVQVVHDVVGPDVPVLGVLCFVEADWPLLGGAFAIRGVRVMWPMKLYKALAIDGPLEPKRIYELHRTLASSLPAA